MNIPNMPPPQEAFGYVELNGKKLPVHISDAWWDVFNQLMGELQGSVSNEGIGIPAQNDDNFSTLNNEKSSNTLLVKESEGKLYFNLAGTYKEIAFV